jgi:hypothetical protein
MKKNGMCLASQDGFGQVYDCGSCGNIHVCVGPVSLSLSPPAYLDLVAMLSTSAANFEMWMERRKALDSDSEASSYGLD